MSECSIRSGVPLALSVHKAYQAVSSEMTAVSQLRLPEKTAVSVEKSEKARKINTLPVADSPQVPFLPDQLSEKLNKQSEKAQLHNSYQKYDSHTLAETLFLKVMYWFLKSL